ncbi:unnamed protein product [Paramecium sonneborni]|uniref:Uncharacterized protein n=1 Tax=Paramecium sonneborni TaxID=65129 RepID=A0A8S1RGK2_9CILI|nr:unnamed protein product [Paramecium sonneborni]
MEFENHNSQSHSTPCFQNQYIYTPDQSQHFYTVPNNTMNPFNNLVQQQQQQPQFWNQGTNLIVQQQQNPNPFCQQAPIQMNTQQFFQQPQEQNEDDQDQDYQPEEEEESSSSESEGLEEDVQEEEQFDDPDFDLQAYLKVRDQL